MEKKRVSSQLKNIQELKQLGITPLISQYLILSQWVNDLPIKHLLILLFIMAAHGSAFPIAKLALNNSVPPILMAALRMALVLLILIPIWKIKIPEKKNYKSLIFFSLSMGVLDYVFMNILLFYSYIISPIILL